LDAFEVGVGSVAAVEVSAWSGLAIGWWIWARELIEEVLEASWGMVSRIGMVRRLDSRWCATVAAV